MTWANAVSVISRGVNLILENGKAALGVTVAGTTSGLKRSLRVDGK